MDTDVTGQVGAGGRDRAGGAGGQVGQVGAGGSWEVQLDRSRSLPVTQAQSLTPKH